MNAIGSISPIVSTPIAGAVLQNDVSANFVGKITFIYAAKVFSLRVWGVKSEH